MYTTCLFCRHDLGVNRVVATFPVGRLLAFDPAKGRLWVVCRHCERWNLSPLEERWEAVEQCERLFRDARQRVCTTNIGLARPSEGVELVRIGAALRPEFAAWRYGDQFGRRRRRALVTTAAWAVGGGAAIAGAVTVGAAALGGYWVYRAGERYARRVRDERLIARVHTEYGTALTVLGSHIAGARLVPHIGGGGGWKLELPHVDGVGTVRGDHALQATGLIMPAINGAGGPQRMVQRAIKRLENFTDPAHYLHSAAAASALRPGGTLAALPLDMRLAIEMAVNEEAERCALEGEMWLLELAWQEAEEIAAIADGLTVPAEVEEKLQQLRLRAGRQSAP
jgi:hypothetical protein